MGSYFGVAGGKWGRLGALQQQHQPPAKQPFLEFWDSTLRLLIADFSVISTIEIKYYCVDTRSRDQWIAA